MVTKHQTVIRHRFGIYHCKVCAKKKSSRLTATNAVLILILLSGCAFEDIDRRAFVTSIGVDASEVKNKKYAVVIKISMSKGDVKVIGSDFILLKVNCNSISDGLDQLRAMSDKKLEYGHVKILLFGEGVAKKDIAMAIDYFMRRPDIQKIAYLGIGKPNAYQLLKFKPKEEAVAGSYFFYTFQQSLKHSPYVYAVTLYDASRRIMTPGLDLTIPVMAFQGKDLQINQIALFDKKQLEVELSSEESKILKMLTSGLYNDTLSLKTSNGVYSVTTEKGKANYKITLSQGKPIVIFSIKLKGGLIERLDDAEVITEDIKNSLAKIAEQQIQKKVYELLIKLREENLDPIGFGLRYRSRHFDHSNDTESWSAFYPELDFKIQVKYKFKEN
nr:Ger(x)C family spore germination protein [Paenibacillus lupini]